MTKSVCCWQYKSLSICTLSAFLDPHLWLHLPHPCTSFGQIKLQAPLHHPRSPPHTISSAWNTLLSCHWPCREQPILRNCTWPSHCISINHTFPMRSAICFKVMGRGERSIETRLAMTDNCSAGIWVFFKIYSLLWYVVELFHFKTFLKVTLAHLHGGCPQHTLKSLKVESGSYFCNLSP